MKLSIKKVYTIITMMILFSYYVLQRSSIMYALMVFCVLFLSTFMITNNHELNITNKISKNYFKIIIFIFIYSLIINTSRTDYSIRFIIELAFIAIPLLICTQINSFNDFDFINFINIMFYMFLILFCLEYATKLSIQNICSISFINSYSPFEGDFALPFTLLTLWYLFTGDNKKFVISILFTILSMKRMMLIAMIICIFIYFISKKIKIGKKHIIAITCINLIIVLSMIALFKSEQIAILFYKIMGISLNKFTMGRYEMFNLVLDPNKNLLGYGATTDFFSNYSVIFNKPGFNVLHSDLLKLFIELNPVGFLLFMYLMYKNSINNRYIFIYCILINFVFIFNHTLDYSVGNFIFMNFLFASNQLNKRENNIIKGDV